MLLGADGMLVTQRYPPLRRRLGSWCVGPGTIDIDLRFTYMSSQDSRCKTLEEMVFELIVGQVIASKVAPSRLTINAAPSDAIDMVKKPLGLFNRLIAVTRHPCRPGSR